MVLIADSGSTKTDWRLADGRKTKAIKTQGINPFFQSGEEIKAIFKKELLPALKKEKISSIFFYGAGCSSTGNRNKVKNAMKSVFPKATIQVEHDLLGAARAGCMHQEGIACILGTGSNSCYYDGEKILKNIPALGFIMGDEGSGAYMGKKLIQAYLYEELPENISKKLQARHQLNKNKILINVYQRALPNRYLASFTPFILQNINDKFIRGIITESFQDFLDHHVSKYPKHKRLKIHFIGSIAWHFKKILTEVLRKNKLKSGLILQSPAEKLLEYHNK